MAINLVIGCIAVAAGILCYFYIRRKAKRKQHISFSATTPPVPEMRGVTAIIEKRYAESNEKRVAFTAMLRERLPAIFSAHGYAQTYDNKDKDQKDSHKWVFRLEFTGVKVIAVYNTDWRDYVEYFQIACDGQEAFYINTDDYGTVELEFYDFRKKLLDIV